MNIGEQVLEVTPLALPPKWIIKDGIWHPVCGNIVNRWSLKGPESVDCAYELQRDWNNCPCCGMIIDWSKVISFEKQDEIDREEWKVNLDE